MLPVAIPDRRADVGGRLEIQLREKCLVFVELELAAEALFEAAHALPYGAAKHHVRGTGRRAATQRIERERQLRGLVDDILANTGPHHDVASRGIVPAPPV